MRLQVQEPMEDQVLREALHQITLCNHLYRLKAIRVVAEEAGHDQDLEVKDKEAIQYIRREVRIIQVLRIRVQPTEQDQ
jgi:hypothetical protein